MEAPPFVLKQCVGEITLPFGVDVQALRAVPGVVMGPTGNTVISYNSEPMHHSILRNKIRVQDFSVAHAERMAAAMWPVYIRCQCDTKTAKASRKRLKEAKDREREQRVRDDYQQEMLQYPYGR